MRWCKYRGDYDPETYKYGLNSSTSLSHFNMEQQAQIIEDYYRVPKGLAPEETKTSGRGKVWAITRPMWQLKAAGPFRWPPEGRKNRDNIGNKI